MAWLWDSGKRKVNFEDAISPYLTQLQTNFQTNINALYNKLVSLGSTPASKTPSAVSNAIQAINDSIYSKLVSLGQTPAGKTVANLNAKIQALTEIFWYFTRTYDGTNDYITGRYDLTNVAELNVLSLDSITYWPLMIYFYNASGTTTGSKEQYNTGVIAIPSGTKYCDILLTTRYFQSASLRFKYQTKVLR